GTRALDQLRAARGDWPHQQGRAALGTPDEVGDEQGDALLISWGAPVATRAHDNSTRNAYPPDGRLKPGAKPAARPGHRPHSVRWAFSVASASAPEGMCLTFLSRAIPAQIVYLITDQARCPDRHG